MFLSYITLAVALSLSVIAAYYSIAGLTAIFAAAVIPIIVMGSILELGKVVVTLWLHEYWRQCRTLMKVYLVPAVAALMLITSMGIFGFLSKAHSDQSLIGGDVAAKIAIYDEKIKTAKENIEANRKQLKQMDAAFDQVMARSQDEKGADKANSIRRSQQRDRAALAKDIEASQKLIASLNDEAAPIRAEVRKVEAEVGPLKYIAALVYGENTDTNALEAAVRWVIILLVIVFDPLAIMMLLAATESLKWEKQRLFELLKMPVPEPEPNWQQRTDELLDIFKDQPTDLDPEPMPPTSVPMKFTDPGEHPKDYDETAVPEPEPEKSLLEQHPYLTAGFPHFKNLTPMVHKPQAKFEIYAGNPDDFKEPWSEEDKQRLAEVMTKFFGRNQEQDDTIDEEHPDIKAAMVKWKTANPGQTLKEQRFKLLRGEITELPWMYLVEQPEPDSGFGTEFPELPSKGDTFVRVDRLPNQVYKFNGNSWIEVDKTTNASYTYNEAYLDHLIAKIDSGEYDIDLLSANEQEQIAQRLQKKAT